MSKRKNLQHVRATKVIIQPLVVVVVKDLSAHNRKMQSTMLCKKPPGAAEESPVPLHPGNIPPNQMNQTQETKRVLKVEMRALVGKMPTLLNHARNSLVLESSQPRGVPRDHEEVKPAPALMQSRSSNQTRQCIRPVILILAKVYPKSQSNLEEMQEPRRKKTGSPNSKNKLPKPAKKKNSGSRLKRKKQSVEQKNSARRQSSNANSKLTKMLGSRPNELEPDKRSRIGPSQRLDSEQK